MAEDPADIARGIISASLYMVLATAGETGRPWASPVYFANSGYAEFFWVSSPDAAHSRNIAVRPQVSIVIFNSQVPIGAGQGCRCERHGPRLWTSDPDLLHSRRPCGHRRH